jgi:cytidine deaminase
MDNKASKDSMELIALAREARMQAYTPYSRFPVGAAVEFENGAVYTGCNIENASFGATVCAERTAIFKAISDGHRLIHRLAVVCGSEKPCMPCGICRQVIAEFAAPDFVCYAAPVEPDRPFLTLSLDDLLPNRFILKP